MGMPPHQLRPGGRGGLPALSSDLPTAGASGLLHEWGEGLQETRGRGEARAAAGVRRGIPMTGWLSEQVSFLLQLSSKPSFAGNTPVWVSGSV